MTKIGMKCTEPRKHLNLVSDKQKVELARRAKLKKELLTEGPKDEAGRPVCWTCKKRGDWRGLTLSHIVPLSRGGKTDRSNCVIECFDCHLSFEKHPDRRT